MKTNTKIIIGAAAGIFLLAALGIAIVVGGFSYVYYRMSDPELSGKINRAKAEAREFAKNSDQNGCMEKGYTLKKPQNTFDISNEEFIRECLHDSRITPNFCDGVPFILDRHWFEDQCKIVGHNTDACTTAFIAKRSYCRMDGKE